MIYPVVTHLREAESMWTTAFSMSYSSCRPYQTKRRQRLVNGTTSASNALWRRVELGNQSEHEAIHDSVTLDRLARWTWARIRLIGRSGQEGSRWSVNGQPQRGGDPGFFLQDGGNYHVCIQQDLAIQDIISNMIKYRSHHHEKSDNPRLLLVITNFLQSRDRKGGWHHESVIWTYHQGTQRDLYPE